MQGQESTIFIYLKNRTELQHENAPERFYCYKVPCTHNENNITEKYNLSASPAKPRLKRWPSILLTRCHSECPIVKSSLEADPPIKFNNAVIKLHLMICKSFLECELCKGPRRAAPSLHSSALLTITHLIKKKFPNFILNCPTLKYLFTQQNT